MLSNKYILFWKEKKCYKCEIFMTGNFSSFSEEENITFYWANYSALWMKWIWDFLSVGHRVADLCKTRNQPVNILFQVEEHMQIQNYSCLMFEYVMFQWHEKQHLSWHYFPSKTFFFLLLYYAGLSNL